MDVIYVAECKFGIGGYNFIKRKEITLLYKKY